LFFIIVCSKLVNSVETIVKLTRLSLNYAAVCLTLKTKFIE